MEKPDPGAQLSLFEQIDGWRYQLGATNSSAKTTHFLEARHRPHVRVEDDIRTGKQTGTRLFALSLNRDQPGLVRSRHHRRRPAGLATPALPGRSAGQSRTQDLRYRLLRTATHIVRGQRKRKIRIPETWPGRHTWQPACLPARRARHAPTDLTPNQQAPTPTQRINPDPWNPAPTRGESRDSSSADNRGLRHCGGMCQVFAAERTGDTRRDQRSLTYS
jgi:hypothetical protein